METLVLDTSAIFNFGHRGQLESLLKKLAKQHRFVTTPVVLDECGKGGHKSFYETFVTANFDVLSHEKAAVPIQVMAHLSGTIDPGELSVILLAMELKATAVLDDKVARQEATKLKVKIMGTLGLVERGRKQKWLTDDQCLDIITKLRAGKFSIRKPGANETFAEYMRTI
jgi:predicted nucleic acid-binding protein